jgi:hypothetical protein
MGQQLLKTGDKKRLSILNALFNESGSATVEFISLALPLFIPLFFYLHSFASISDSQANLHTLSREMARAFVTSENDEVADRVTYEVFVKGANVLGLGVEVGGGELIYRYSCSQSPCISPNNKITVTLLDNKSGVEISTVEYVSPWA